MKIEFPIPLTLTEELAKQIEEAFVALNTQAETDAETIEDLEEKVASLNALIGKANTDVTKIEDAVKNVAAGIPAEGPEVDGKKYQWKVAGFRLPGDAERYSAIQANEDPELVEKILAIEGQNILVEVVE